MKDIKHVNFNSNLKFKKNDINKLKYNNNKISNDEYQTYDDIKETNNRLFDYLFINPFSLLYNKIKNKDNDSNKSNVLNDVKDVNANSIDSANTVVDTSNEKIKEKIEDNKINKKVYYSQKYYENYFYGDGSIIDYNTGKPATIAEYGCAPTCISMVVSSILEKEITPVDVNKILFEKGGCTENGTDVEKVMPTLKEYNLNVSRTNDIEELSSKLSTNEYMAIVSVGPGDFTKTGHYIVLSYSKEKDKVMVYDPYNKENCHYWNIETVWNQRFLDDSVWLISK